MKISELMVDIIPVPTYEGVVTADDMVFAISNANAAEVDDYLVAEQSIIGIDAQLNPITIDSNYLRAGLSTTKTGTQRQITVTGDKYVGDEFIDLCLSAAMTYGTGHSVIVDYVLFNVLNGKGEKGKMSLIVNNDASGNAGENATISIDFKKFGSNPTEYTYVSTAPLNNLTVSVADSETAGSTTLTITPFAGASAYKYTIAGATAGVVPSLGESASTYTAATLTDNKIDIATTNAYYIIVVAVDASGNCIAGKQVQAIIS